VQLKLPLLTFREFLGEACTVCGLVSIGVTGSFFNVPLLLAELERHVGGIPDEDSRTWGMGNGELGIGNWDKSFYPKARKTTSDNPRTSLQLDRPDQFQDFGELFECPPNRSRSSDILYLVDLPCSNQAYRH
jgi:hypothetical protein